ncbi:hypothetical protein [Hafnia paralvei]|nr:hypothetical protein [Hafnia paralvei]
MTLFVRSSGKKIWRFRYRRPSSAASASFAKSLRPDITQRIK